MASSLLGPEVLMPAALPPSTLPGPPPLVYRKGRSGAPSEALRLFDGVDVLTTFATSPLPRVLPRWPSTASRTSRPFLGEETLARTPRFARQPDASHRACPSGSPATCLTAKNCFHRFVLSVYLMTACISRHTKDEGMRTAAGDSFRYQPSMKQ